MLVAPDGLVYRRPVTIAERRDAFNYAVLFQGGPACINPDDAGLPSNIVETSLRHHARVSGGLTWMLTFDGRLMVGGVAAGLHPEDGIHGFVIVSWNAPGYDAEYQRRNAVRAKFSLAPMPQDCCQQKWSATLPLNSIEYNEMAALSSEPPDDEILLRYDKTGPSGLVTRTVSITNGPFELLGP